MLTAIASDQIWPDVAGSQRVFQNLLLFCFVLLLTNHLMTGLLGNSESNLIVSFDFVSGNIGNLGKQNSLFPSGPVIKC